MHIQHIVWILVQHSADKKCGCEKVKERENTKKKEIHTEKYVLKIFIKFQQKKLFLKKCPLDFSARKVIENLNEKGLKEQHFLLVKNECNIFMAGKESHET